MVGILLITHGNLGQVLAENAYHILGKTWPNLRTLSVDKSDEPDMTRGRAQALIDELDDGGGVVVLSDMLGGTPANVASALIRAGRIETVCGVNLPMLVRALSYSGQSLDIVVSKAVTGGLEGVVYVIPGEGNGQERG
jgi:PTS system ascorbate-specific IIA component